MTASPTTAWLYNARTGVYDPTKPVVIRPLELDPPAERPFLLVTYALLKKRGGPLSRQLGERVLMLAPEEERNHLRFTVRCEWFSDGKYPYETPVSWHTDYAHGITDLTRRQACHSYALVTAAPYTVFIREANVQLPDTRAAGFAFDRARTAARLTQFSVEPWTFVRFNATELHTATVHRGEPGYRLFFRATFDPIRFPAK